MVSLEKAFAAVSAGTTIDLRGGTYPGEVVLQNRSFSSSDPVTIQSYPGETATFTGDPSRECYAALYLGNVTGVRLRSLQLSASFGNGYKLDDVAHVEIDKNRVVNNGCQGIYVGGVTVSGWSSTYSSDVQIWNSTFSNNGGYFTGNESFAAKGDHSIYLGGGALDGTQHGIVGGVIANNVIYGQDTGYGIQLGMSAKNIIVTNNTIDSTSNTCCNDSAGNAIQLAGPMALSDIAQTSQGPMVGDYISTSFVGASARVSFAVGLPHGTGPFDEAMYAPVSALAVATPAEATNPASSAGVIGPVTGVGTGETHHDLKQE